MTLPGKRTLGEGSFWHLACHADISQSNVGRAKVSFPAISWNPSHLFCAYSFSLPVIREPIAYPAQNFRRDSPTNCTWNSYPETTTGGCRLLALLGECRKHRTERLCAGRLNVWSNQNPRYR